MYQFKRCFDANRLLGPYKFLFVECALTCGGNDGFKLFVKVVQRLAVFHGVLSGQVQGVGKISNVGFAHLLNCLLHITCVVCCYNNNLRKQKSFFILKLNERGKTILSYLVFYFVEG